MAKARRIRGVRAKAPLRDNAQLVISVRLDEFLAWSPALEDDSRVADLHNMRIAAKRLRYALELFQVCFPAAKPFVKTLTDVQDALGDIHDLDVLTGLLRDRLQAQDREMETRAIAVTDSDRLPAEKSNQLRGLLYAQAREPRRLGLIGLLGDKIVERRRMYDEFAGRWRGLGLGDFAHQLRQAVELEPPPEPLAAEEALPPVEAGGA